MTRAAACGAVLAAALAALLAAGCAGRAARPLVTVAGCAAAGAQAIEQHRTLVRAPAACRGLTQAQLNLAVAKAVYQAAGGRPKAAWRRLAAADAARLGRLVRQLRPAARAAPAAPGAGGSPGTGRAVAVAALVSWLLAAASGGYLLASWLAHGGARARRGLSPAVVFCHFGLALAGLAGWAGYLASGSRMLAWAAVGLLVPVSGLGMATLAIGLPFGPGRTAPAAAAAGTGEAGGVAAPGAAAAGGAAAPGGAAGAGGAAAPGGAAGTALAARLAAPARAARPPVLIIAAHGALAMLTLLLALLAAIGAG